MAEKEHERFGKILRRAGFGVSGNEISATGAGATVPEIALAKRGAETRLTLNEGGIVVGDGVTILVAHDIAE